jgi:alkylation response protein AidB-like acyl-CoA dehydrogenase
MRRDEDIVNFVKEANGQLGGYVPGHDPAIRDKIAELLTEVKMCRLVTMRSMSIAERGGKFNYECSAEKVSAPEHGVRTTEAITQMLGLYGQLLHGRTTLVLRTFDCCGQRIIG